MTGAQEQARPEPNFARLVTEQDLAALVVSAHALRRFVQRLQPDIAGADQVAKSMARLEDLGSGNRTGPQQGQLNRYRDRTGNHVEPPGLLAAFGVERSDAIENTRLENERRQADADTSRRQWKEQHDRAARIFRERHSHEALPPGKPSRRSSTGAS